MPSSEQATAAIEMSCRRDPIVCEAVGAKALRRGLPKRGERCTVAQMSIQGGGIESTEAAHGRRRLLAEVV
jgi:hypothetical protein